MKKGYIISLIIILVLSVFVFFRLRSNKENIDRLTSLAEETISEYPVRTIEARRSNKTSITTLSGRLSAAEEIILTSALAGRVAKIHVQNGDQVSKGALLISLEDKIIQSEVSIAKAAYEKAKTDLEKFTKLRESDAVTSQQLELLKLNEQSSRTQYEGALQKLKETRITSPITGTVHQVMTKVGSLCGPATPVCELVDARSLKLKLGIGENIASRVSAEDTVLIDVPVVNQKKLIGKVTYVGVKPGFTGLFPLEIELENNGMLKAGYLAEVSLMESFSNVLSIPKIAIQGTANDRYVFTVSGEAAQLQPVNIGPSVNNEVVITSGIKEGDLIITEGANRLRDGSLIKVVSD